MKIFIPPSFARPCPITAEAEEAEFSRLATILLENRPPLACIAGLSFVEPAVGNFPHLTTLQYFLTPCNNHEELFLEFDDLCLVAPLR